MVPWGRGHRRPNDGWMFGDDVISLLCVCVAIPDTIAAVGAPFFGLLVDKFGYRGYVMLACALTLSAVHFSFAFAPSSSSPAPELAFLGRRVAVGDAIIDRGCRSCVHCICCLHVAVAISLRRGETYRHGLRHHPRSFCGLHSFSFVEVGVLNLQAAVIPLCVSAVLTAPGSSFFFVELFFALLALCGAVSCIVLNVWSKRDHNDCLNVPSARVVKP